MLPDIAGLRNIPLCIDGRLIGDAAIGSGVASYATALLDAVRTQGLDPILLLDRNVGHFGERRTRYEKAARWVAAASNHVRPVARDPATGDLVGHDLFRLAHVHFARRGTLLRLATDGPPGIIHWTYPVPMRIEGWSNIYTVHDVIPLVHTHLSFIDRAAMRRRLKLVARSAARIVTVSDHAHGEIVRALALPPSCVVNCGNAVTALEPAGKALPAGLIAGRYLLYCGAISGRKNLDRLVDAWAAGGRVLPLVIVGPLDTGGEAALARLRLFPGLILLPYQPRALLMDLIANARALLFASLQEGFGLPVAEAMALGTPVLTSNRDALAETAGGAALGVDPRNRDEIERGIAALANDDALHADLRAKGLARAAAFVPERLGERVVALYAATLPNRPHLPIPGETGEAQGLR